MALSGGDLTWVVYQGPPRWDGQKWINGDRFFLSGHSLYQRDLGVEWATEFTGLGRETVEERYDQPADLAGARYVTSVPDKRTVTGAVNIVGDSPGDFRFNHKRWLYNHPSEPGKLWFFSDGEEPRYLLARKSAEAGTETVPKDPGLRALREADWGWTSDSPYYMGFKTIKELKQSGNSYSATFFNPSTVDRVYPVLNLPGGASWKVNLGGKRGDFTTPLLLSNESARIDFNPLNPTFLKRNLDTGEVTNLWPSMIGDRPRLWIEPLTKNEFSVTKAGGSTNGLPTFEFTPLFSSWI